MMKKMVGGRCAAKGRAKSHPPPLRLFLAPSLSTSFMKASTGIQYNTVMHAAAQLKLLLVKQWSSL